MIKMFTQTIPYTIQHFPNEITNFWFYLPLEDSIQIDISFQTHSTSPPSNGRAMQHRSRSGHVDHSGSLGDAFHVRPKTKMVTYVHILFSLNYAIRCCGDFCSEIYRSIFTIVFGLSMMSNIVTGPLIAFLIVTAFCTCPLLYSCPPKHVILVTLNALGWIGTLVPNEITIFWFYLPLEDSIQIDI